MDEHQTRKMKTRSDFLDLKIFLGCNEIFTKTDRIILKIVMNSLVTIDTDPSQMK